MTPTREEVALLFAFADGMRAQEDAGAELTVLQRETVRWAALCRMLEEAALAFQELNVCYRAGKQPSEKLFKRLDKARETLALLPTEGESDDS